MPIEHQNQRVLTTQQLAEAYGTDPKTISNNFTRNKERYTEGKHFYRLEGEKLQAFKGIHQFDDNLKFAPILYLWTEKGAWLHAKSLGTDEAWEAYEMLVDEYYRIKEATNYHLPQTYGEALRELATTWEEKEALKEQVALMAPKAEFFDAVADSKDAIDIGSAAKVLNCGIGRTKLFKFLRENQVLMKNNVPYQEFIDRGYFRVIEQKYSKPDGTNCINTKTLVYQRGLNYIRKLLENKLQLA